MQRVSLDVLDLDLEWGHECEFDQLTIYDGMDDSADVLETLCGRGQLGVVHSCIYSVYYYLHTRMYDYRFVCFHSLSNTNRCENKRQVDRISHVPSLPVEWCR